MKILDKVAAQIKVRILEIWGQDKGTENSPPSKPIVVNVGGAH